MTPGLEEVLVLFGAGVEAEAALALASPSFTTTEPSWPAFAGDLAEGLLDGAAEDATPIAARSLTSRPSSAFWARMRATPPPGTMPSSTAARVALSASSTRAFFSFISISVARRP
jgi:hypothetical protein